MTWWWLFWLVVALAVVAAVVGLARDQAKLDVEDRELAREALRTMDPTAVLAAPQASLEARVAELEGIVAAQARSIDNLLEVGRSQVGINAAQLRRNDAQFELNANLLETDKALRRAIRAAWPGAGFAPFPMTEPSSAEIARLAGLEGESDG